MVIKLDKVVTFNDRLQCLKPHDLTLVTILMTAKLGRVLTEVQKANALSPISCFSFIYRKHISINIGYKHEYIYIYAMESRSKTAALVCKR